MNKAEFNKVVQKMLVKHFKNSNIEEANTAIDVFTDSVTEALKDNDEISLVGFGKFSKSKIKARKGRNPKTGESMDIPAYYQVRFSVGKSLKESANSSLNVPQKKKEKK